MVVGGKLRVESLPYSQVNFSRIVNNKDLGDISGEKLADILF